jgi:hypothetical protein
LRPTYARTSASLQQLPLEAVSVIRAYWIGAPGGPETVI